MTSPNSTICPYALDELTCEPTPIVVENFKLPNCDINQDGPYLAITEPPQNKFRFRYKSEMVGTHGQLKAESSDKNKTVYPTVKLYNWNGGPCLIRLSLYTAEDNANDRKLHVHELSGKNCSKNNFPAGCEVVVDEKNNYTAQFPNLGIIHIAKREVQSIIFHRKKEQLINYGRLREPNLRIEEVKHNISPTEIQKLREEAEEEAKGMDLNKVVLRFQAFFFNMNENRYQPITKYVDSDVIFNLKNASTGELKIVRISAVSAPCTGGTEVWMLVEKVKKSNVKIKFYELDADGCEIWKGYGDFKESDVHHQYAIVFKTPPYRSNTLSESVQVKVQLERTTDNDTSDSLDFTYTPENLKRRNVFIEQQIESEISKKMKPEPIDLKVTNRLFLVPGDAKEPNVQSPPRMVPSPVTPAASPSSQIGFYSPVPNGSSIGGTISMTPNTEEESFSVVQEGSQTFNIGSQIINSLEPNSTTQVLYDPSGNNYITAVVQGGNLLPSSPFQVTYSNQVLTPFQNGSPPYQQVPSPDQSQPSPYNCQGYDVNFSIPQPYHDSGIADTNLLPETPQSQIRQFDEFQKNHDFSDLLSTNPFNQTGDGFGEDLLAIANNPNYFLAPNGSSDIRVDCANKNKSRKKSKSPESNAQNNVDALADQLAGVQVTDAPTKPRGERCKRTEMLDRDIASRIALRAADCLQLYAAYGDISLLLAAHRYLLGVQNSQGDNSLHTAISNKNSEVFNKIVDATVEVFASDMFNAQNFSGETPLHLAVKEEQPAMIQRLIESPACRIDITDCNGNTPLHLAAQKSNDLSLLLLSATNRNIVSKIINAHNFHGKTPLHLAVASGCLNKVKLLLDANADVHICERKQGGNALHLAVMFRHELIVEYLINKTDITVDARMFDGNTALHLAAEAGHKIICALLMAAKANPEAPNNIRKSSKDDYSNDDEEDINDGDDEGEEEESEEEFFTPLDYAKENEEITSILKGNIVSILSKRATLSSTKESDTKQNSAIDSGIDISGTDLQEKV